MPHRLALGQHLGMSPATTIWPSPRSAALVPGPRPRCLLEASAPIAHLHLSTDAMSNYWQGGRRGCLEKLISVAREVRTRSGVPITLAPFAHIRF